MDNFTQYKKSKSSWLSSPFYSSPQGYKMRILVYANGHNEGAGTHVSMYTRIIKGEYDDTLTWPYNGTVTLTIINWKDDNHIKTTIPFRNDEICGKKPVMGKNNEAIGYFTILPHDELYGELYGNNSQYIKNDMLYIIVDCVTV